MSTTRVKISQIVQNQLPSFIRDDFPLAATFFEEYYRSTEYPGAAYDLIQNIDHYIKLDNNTNLIEETRTTAEVQISDDVITVESTKGFPDSYGLLKIDSEIITYTSKDNTNFYGCIRGFSGTEELKNKNNPEALLFVETESDSHAINSVVENLSILFLQEFLRKLKIQFAPGFEDRSLYDGVNENVFVKSSNSFYRSKGTEESFKILFRALYGKEVALIRPRDYLIQPSDAEYRVTRDLVIEAIENDPSDLLNRTLFQGSIGEIPRAYGSVTNVQKIQRDGKNYYILSLDFDFDKDINVSGSVFGKFTINPKTFITDDITIPSTTINVDSTVGFPTSGTLKTTINDSELTITYQSKSLTQFYDCSGIDLDIAAGQEIALDEYAYALLDRENGTYIRVRITGVLGSFNLNNDAHNYSIGDTAEIVSLGVDEDSFKFNNWVFNIPMTYQIESFTKIANGYEISTKDSNSIVTGDNITLNCVLDNQTQATLNLNVNSVIIPEKSFRVITTQNILAINFVRKNLNKVQNTVYTADVQNIYKDSLGSLYVTSSSLPNYSNNPLDIRDRSVTFNHSGISTDIIVLRDSNSNPKDHNFLTGDAVVYYPESDSNVLGGLSRGVYFASRVSNNSLKLSNSRENIFKQIFITITGNATNSKFVPLEFVDVDLNPKELKSQKLIRQIPEPENDGIIYETKPGPIGILANGVEILNYKSGSAVFYGGIQEINVTAGGSDYDLINPPILEIIDTQVINEIETTFGSGATGICRVEGNLKRIDVLDSGFDYLAEPKIVISGGNGTGARAKANLISVDHFVNFNAESTSGHVDLVNNILRFADYHKFRDNEIVYYDNNNKSSVGGLTEKTTYFVSVQDDYRVKLHLSLEDCISGINTVNLTSYGEGNQFISSYTKKKILGSITVLSAGNNYKNRKIQVSVSGINTASNTINATNHGYKDGDIIVYSSNGTPVAGLSTQSSYIVTRVNNNSFKLSSVGIGTSVSDFFFRTNQYIDLASSGSGIHEFNYPPITVAVEGITGISTISTIGGNAQLQPIFRGNISSVFLTNSGTNYGTPDIIDYDRKPRFRLKTGSGAQLSPIVINGRIAKVLILNAGKDYNTPPEIVTSSEKGKGAILVPILEAGKIKDIKIISGGFNYTQNDTAIFVRSSGKNCNLNFKIRAWNVNLKAKLDASNQISTDDGVITSVSNDEFGLQYTHAYSPSKLRNILYSSNNENGQILYRADILNDTENKLYHSPILGWAYDGNPIYGPYGYGTREGNGQIKRLVSGYQLIQGATDRPNFPDGFFIEDYVYLNGGDLDENNGRFCRTPEYPNGTYAYFVTLDINRLPQFPYIVGNYYKSKPIDFNFNINSNQDMIDLQNTGWLRNTHPYNLNGKYSKYEFVFNPNNTKKQLSNVNYSSSGGIEEIKIISGGENYKVNDVIIFNNDDTSGINANAIISYIGGKRVTNIASDYSESNNIEFTVSGKSRELVGYCNLPHNFIDQDFINVTDVENYPSLQRTYQVGVTTSTLVLSENVQNSANTGIVTYFNVYGSLKFSNVRENDVYQIETEQIRVLNVDELNSRIRIQRNYNGTPGNQHSAGQILYEKTRKFTFETNNDINYDYVINKEFYFDPQETLGVGATVVFSNPGIGITQIFIENRHLYLPNHTLKTGTRVKYNANGGTPFSVSNQYGSFQLQNDQELFVARINNNFIGISTNLVGIGTTGGFIGVGTDTSIVSFDNYGSGAIHSIKTNYVNVVKGNANKRDAIITTAESHDLQAEDIVEITCTPGITTTFYVRYNDYNRRLTLNPINFSSINVLTDRSILNISSHNFKTGDKLIHTSAAPVGGLVDNGIYYAVVLDENNIQLSSSYYNATQKEPIAIILTTSSFGTLSKVNPEISIYKNYRVVFDVSDSSLSFNDGLLTFPSFDLNFFLDSNFSKEFVTDKTRSQFTIQKIGTIGTPNAKVIINLRENTPSVLYYALIPNPATNNYASKKEIIIDSENINSNNKINIKASEYNGSYRIVSKTNNTFRINTRTKPESQAYSNGISYKTNSKNAKGNIVNIQVKSKGSNYRKLPSITGVASTTGSNAILTPRSTTIGKIENENVTISDIGFEYSCDLTLNPTAKLPDILKIEPLSSFKSVGIVSTGNNYFIPPDLIVIDGFTNKIVTDVLLEFGNDSTELVIRKNSNGFYNVPPKIIPINNSNGNRITDIQYDSITNEVTVYLNNLYEAFTEHPFQVGDKVLIENVKTLNGKGFNSEFYNYQLFEITDRSALIFSPYYVKYNLSSHLTETETPGTYDSIESYGRIIKEKDFPIFNTVLQKNVFLPGEKVSSSGASGIVESWDANNEYLKIQTQGKFVLNDTLIGKTSGSRGIISEINTTTAFYQVDASSVFRKGWNRETGFLNKDTQRIHDSDYYQYFSYSLKSEIPFETWNDPVSSLNHASGFKKFADLLMTSRDSSYSGIQTSQDEGNLTGIADLSNVIDVNCYSDFDLVTENILNLNGGPISDKLFFNSVELADYSELVGNRVLIIDDISDQFISEVGIKNYITIDTFNKFVNKVKKYYILINNKTNTERNETVFVSLLNNTNNIFVSQYAKLDTESSTGFFDASIVGNSVDVLFYPISTADSYDLSFISYDINDIITGIGTTTFGNINTFTTKITTINPYLTENIIKFPSDNRSCRALLQLESANQYQFLELSIIHDGSTVSIIEYGKLNDIVLGDYSGYISGSDVCIDFASFVVDDVKINTSLILTSDSTKTTTGSQAINNSIHSSELTLIASSSSPGITTVSSYDSTIYGSSYLIATIEDTTNNDYQMSEVIVVNNQTDSYITEFGILPTNNKLGEFSTSKVGDIIEVYFEPIANINCEVRIFSSTLKPIDILNPIYSIEI